MPLSFWLDHFLDSRAEIHQIFAGFFGKLKTSKSHSEINWPLQQSKNSNRTSQPFSTTAIFRDDASSEDNGTVKVEKMEEFKIVCIGINRPAKRNCVNKVTAEKLYDAFSDFENDDNLNCAVLHGKYLRNSS